MPLSDSHKETRKYDGRATVDISGGQPVIRGYAVVFNEPSVVMGSWEGDFQEVIRPAAMARTMREAWPSGPLDLRAFFGHDPNRVLGRHSAGTLRYAVDAHGLRVEIVPDMAITDHADVVRQIQRRDITGMSFSFRTMPNGDDWNHATTPPTRYVTDMRVYEVSPVAMPAYEQTDVEVALRSLARSRGDVVTIKALQAKHEARAAEWQRQRR